MDKPGLFVSKPDEQHTWAFGPYTLHLVCLCHFQNKITQVAYGGGVRLPPLLTLELRLNRLA